MGQRTLAKLNKMLQGCCGIEWIIWHYMDLMALHAGVDQRGGTWVMTPHPLGPEAPPAYQGHHRPSRGTTELPRDTTYLSELPQACQEHHQPSRAPVRGTMGLQGAPQACQGHQLSSRGTTDLPEASPA